MTEQVKQTMRWLSEGIGFVAAVLVAIYLMPLAMYVGVKTVRMGIEAGAYITGLSLPEHF